MQDRRYRPGDVLDDYCPRERRITDHAIVAMIEDEIRRTRCGSCDAEHEYKEAKVPSPRRKTQPPALFTQVLEGMNGPTPPHRSPPPRRTDELPPPLPNLTSFGATAAAEPTPSKRRSSPPPSPSARAGDRGTPTTTARGRRQPRARRVPAIVDTRHVPAAGWAGATAPRRLPNSRFNPCNNRRNGGGQRHAGGPEQVPRRPAAAGRAAAARIISGRCASAITAARPTTTARAAARGRAADAGGEAARRTADGRFHGKDWTHRRRREPSLAGVGHRAGHLEGRRQPHPHLPGTFRRARRRAGRHADAAADGAAARRHQR